LTRKNKNLDYEHAKTVLISYYLYTFSQLQISFGPSEHVRYQKPIPYMTVGVAAGPYAGLLYNGVSACEGGEVWVQIFLRVMVLVLVQICSS